MKKTLLFFVLILNAGISYGQDFVKSLNHVTIVVSDFDASKKFYTEVLGLEQIDAPWLPEKQMFLALGEGLELHVGEIKGVEIKPNGINHFAIAVPEFDEFLSYLRSKGIVYAGLGGGEDYFIATRPDKVRQTWIKDPDGYMIEINDID